MPVVPLFVGLWILVIAIAIAVGFASARTGLRNARWVWGWPVAVVCFAGLELGSLRFDQGSVAAWDWFLPSILLIALLGVGFAMRRYTSTHPR